jgi:hypothetical protein
VKLIELEPRWLEVEGKRIGFVFRCPTNRDCWQSCFQRPTPPQKLQRKLFEAMFGDADHLVQGCNPQHHWTIAPELADATFEAITVKPSIDGSAGGNWHGFITAGEIVTE